MPAKCLGFPGREFYLDHHSDFVEVLVPPKADHWFWTADNATFSDAFWIMKFISSDIGGNANY